MKTRLQDILMAFKYYSTLYPTFLQGRSQDNVNSLANIWLESFKNTDVEIFNQAVQNISHTSEYVPNLANVYKEAENIAYGDFNSELIWNDNYPLMLEMLNNNQDDIDWYRDDFGLECKHKYFNAWEKLDSTLKATFVRPSAVVDLLRASDFEFNSFKNRYCKEAINLEKEFRNNPQLRELVKKQRKPVELATLKNEIGKLSFNDTKRLE